MKPVEIKPDVFWIGVNDRTSELFEGLWPIQEEGISYNAYLINDQKKAVIDMSKELTTEVFIDHINEIFPVSLLDYIIVNHVEPDHTGAVLRLRELAPNAKIVCSKKAGLMLTAFYGIQENIEIVYNEDTLDLGSHKLQFISTPFVHWPETMMTYETTERILFSCDAFGGYGTLDGSIFDGECPQLSIFKEEALRYFSNIVAGVSMPTLKAITKLGEYPISMVAPAHGLVWRDQPDEIISLYKKWAEATTTPSEMGVTLVYGSMYGNTEKMLDFVLQGLAKHNIPTQVFDIQHTHPSYILSSLIKSNGVIVGAPTYEKSLFPPIKNWLEYVKIKGIKNRKAAYFGSYGWAGAAKKEFEQIAVELNWELLDVLEFNGRPQTIGVELGIEFGEKFARSVQI